MDERFNPRTHEECDNLDILSVSIRSSFNPRTHEECDSVLLIRILVRNSFNPRTHEECDIFLYDTFIHIELFQSTHSRGVRRYSFFLSRFQILKT